MTTIPITPKTDNSHKRKPSRLGPYQTTVTLALLLIAMFAFAWYAKPGLNWILVISMMVIFLTVIGIAITKRPLGILINDYCIISLSRFQLVLWTLIVISGYFVIVIARIKQGDVADPLAVGIDPTIWTLLGISTASLAGSPLITSTKQNKNPSDEAKQKAGREAKALLGDKEDQVDEEHIGVLFPNKDPAEARITDMFEGEELSNWKLVDLAKVQMFFFTIVIAIAYGAELLHMIMADDLTVDNIALPTVNEGLLAVMGISHAGYLGKKSVTETPQAK